jgi:hypothetical protein
MWKVKKSELIEMIEKNGTLSRGKKSLIKHLENGKIGRKEAMDAKCYFRSPGEARYLQLTR